LVPESRSALLELKRSAERRAGALQPLRERQARVRGARDGT
jgi:hypothetical protein